MWDNLKRAFGVFSVLAAVLGFFLNVVALFQMFGVQIILAPVPSVPSLESSMTAVKLSADVETLTLLAWIYSSIVLVWFALRRGYSGDSGFVPLLSCGTVPMLLMMWLWVFGYLPAWSYVLLLPTTIVAVMAVTGGYLGYIYAAYNSLARRTLVIVDLAAFGFVVLWFRGNFGWTLPLTLPVALFLCAVTTETGYNLGRLLASRSGPDYRYEPFVWLIDAIRGY